VELDVYFKLVLITNRQKHTVEMDCTRRRVICLRQLTFLLSLLLVIILTLSYW